MKQNIRRHRKRPEEQGVGTEEASLQRPIFQPTAVPPHGSDVAGLHGVAGLQRPPWRTAGAMFVRYYYVDQHCASVDRTL